MNSYAPLPAKTFALPVRDTRKTPEAFQGGETMGSEASVIVAVEMERAVGQHLALLSLGRMAATVAHELRNPLGSIKGAAQFLLREIDENPVGSEEVRKATLRDFLTIVVDEADRLDHMTGDLLIFAQPRAARQTPTDLCALIIREIRLLAPSFAMLGVETPAFAPDFETTAMARVDGDQVGRAVRNLLLNAAQAASAAAASAETDNGAGARAAARVGITLRALDGEGGGDGWQIAVSDNGPGVPVAHREAIWEPFWTNRAQGTGLGLAMVRQTAEAHGGSVAVATETDPTYGGSGARFTLTLPILKEEATRR